MCLQVLNYRESGLYSVFYGPAPILARLPFFSAVSIIGTCTRDRGKALGRTGDFMAWKK